MPLLKYFFDMLQTRVENRGMRVEGDGVGGAGIIRAVDKSAPRTKRVVRHDDGGDGSNDDDDGNPLEKISNTHHLAQYFNFKL